MSQDSASAAKVCPRCSFEAPETIGAFSECPACGVVVAKALAANPDLEDRDAAATPNASEYGQQDPGDTPLTASAGADGLYQGPTDFDDPWTASPSSKGHSATQPTETDETPARSGRGNEATPHRTFATIEREHRQRRREQRHGITREVLIGSAVGALVWLLPTSRLFDLFSVLVHETGHTLTFWLFGYPTIPSFDLAYLGGVSVYFFRLTILCWLVIGLLVLWLWQARGYLRLQALIVGIITAYAILNWTGLHQQVGTAMGHGGELLFATIFFYRALRPPYSQQSFERPFYAGSGAYLTLHSLAFAFRLATNEEMQRNYLRGMRGMRHDLVRLADWLGTDFTNVALLLGLASLLPPLLAWLLHHNRERWRLQWIEWLQGH